jgi:hypothetical protein
VRRVASSRDSSLLLGFGKNTNHSLLLVTDAMH